MIDGAVPSALPGAVVRLPLIQATASTARLDVPGVARFLLGADGALVVERAASATDADVRCFADGPVTALAELLQGRFSLRAAAVDVDGRAVAICGATAGKSTLAAALARGGRAVLTDAVATIDGAPPAVTCRGRGVDLWPDAAGRLDLGPDEGAIVRPALPKRRFTVGPPPPTGPVPLGAVVVVTVDGLADRPSVEEVTGARKVELVTAHQWHRLLVAPLGLEAAHFRWSMAVTAGRVLHLRRPKRWTPVEELTDLLDARWR